ncbi:MAG: hypothetical protein HZB39_02330 [Planctomycetes bacterium]|nr:hypothetical protein [Planctomycetota bacterium]
MTEQSPADGERTTAAPTRVRRRKRGPGLAVGKVFGTSFRIWGRNLLPFVLLGVIVYVPYAWFLAWSEWQSGLVYQDDAPAWLPLANQLLARLSSLLVAAPVIGAVFAELRGKRASLGTTLGTGLLRLPRAIGVAIAQGAAFVAWLIPLFLLGAVGVPVPALFVLGLGSLAGIVVMMLGFYVAVPVAIVERCGVIASLVRSWRLTRGSRAQLFAVTFFFALLGALVGMAVGGVIGVAFPDLPEWQWSSGLVAIIAWMEADLRLAVDGVDPDEIARVFE